MWTTETCIHLFSHPVVPDSFWPTDCSTPSLQVPHHLLKLAQVHVHYIGDAIQPSHHALMPSSPSALNLSQHWGLHQCVICSHQMTLPMCHLFTSDDWSFSVSISPSSKYSGLISLKIDWFDLLAVQGTFRSLLQHHSPKASILWRSAFFMVQLSHPLLKIKGWSVGSIGQMFKKGQI